MLIWSSVHLTVPRRIILSGRGKETPRGPTLAPANPAVLENEKIEAAAFEETYTFLKEKITILTS
jgi:hypothetical protein